MTKLFITILIIFGIIACHKGQEISPGFYDCHLDFPDSSRMHPQHARYAALLAELTAKGVPGLLMSVYHPETGMWLGARGKADLRHNIDMQPCHITRVGSTVKMFTAVAVLQLMEEGKLHLDDQISAYLSGDAITKIENADKATIRQLLNHSSGIYNYIQSAQFQTASINDLIREWKPDDLLRYAFHKRAYFSPGEDVRYSNTNYILLGMLIEQIEKKPFYTVFKEKIFTPYGLTSTQFAAEDPVPDGIVRGYIDLYSNLNVIESTYFSGWDYYTADGGLISNPYDLAVFFIKLMRGEIITRSSLNEMLEWQNPRNPDAGSADIQYGLGIFKMNTPYGEAYFHSGDAIGYYAKMVYFPADGSVVVWASNGNYGKIDQFISTQSATEHILHITRYPVR